MKQLLLLVSLVLLSFFSLIDNQKEQPYLANTDRILSLSCPDYLPPKLNINETSNLNIPEDAAKNISNDWYSRAINNIRQEEYNITYSEEARAFQSYNRANNILFTYHKNGFTAKTMQTKIPLFDVNDRSLSEKDKKYEELEEWSVELRIKNYQLGINNEGLSSSGKKASIENENIKINYSNKNEGMRQDFVLKENISGKDDIELLLNVSSTLKMNISKDAVMFCAKKDGSEKMLYSSLRVWDANNKILDSYFEKRGSAEFAIVVDDRNAEYPVTIDPLSSTPDWIKSGDFGYGDEFGYSVADAGDINHDGYSDVIIGSPGYYGLFSDAGRASVFYGSPSGLSTNAGWTFDCNVENARFGYSVSGAGDLNGDNFDDVIIGAPDYSNGQTNEGRVFVFYGSNTGLNTSPAWVYESNKEFAKTGYSVSKAGDFNHDGYDDIIIGSPGYGNDFFNAQGRVFIFRGSSIAISSAPDNTFKNMLDGYTGFGSSVSSAGDINNDGFFDVIIGEPYWPPPPSLGSAGTLESQGKVSVVYGAASDIFSGWSATGEKSHSLFGYSVCAAGDVNNDGYSDIVIGSPNYHYDYCVTSGKVYVYNGSAAGLSSAPDWYKDCSNMGFTSLTEGFGRSVSGTDLNNDGYSDIIIGAHYTDWDNLGDTVKTSAYVYYGSSTGPEWENGWLYVIPDNYSTYITVSGLNDVNGDGYGEVIIGTKRFNIFPTSNAEMFYGGYNISVILPDWQVEPESGYSFGYCVSGGGDIDNDGYDDVIIGAPVSNPDVAGRAYIFFGSPTGLPHNSYMIFEGTGGYGTAVSIAGDVNNDGFDDAIISAPYLNTGGLYGKVYLYLGRNGGLWSVPAWTGTSLGPGGNFGASLSCAGDVNADGYSDIVIGNNGNQLYNSHNVGAYIFCGSPSGITGNIPAWTASVPSDVIISGFGKSVSTAGDVNGDNFDDVIVGTFPEEYQNTGKAFVYYGQTERAMFASEDWSAEGDSLFGYSVSDAGDVNKDGFDDIIISSIVSNEFNGVVNLFKGSLYGPSITPDWSASGNVASLFGSSLSSAGDYNGDGYSDFVVGEYHGMNSYLFLGSNNFPDSDPDIELRNAAMSVSSAGDVNGDGFDDVVTGKTRANAYYGRSNSFHIFPKRAIVLIAQEFCSNVVVTTPSGKPMPGINVSYVLKGANHDSVSVITDNNGMARYCYSGSNHGYDTIIARSGILADTSIVLRDYPSPVELASFNSSVSGRDVMLSWTTTSEINNSGFEVEKSYVKGQMSNEWSKIGFVQGIGNSEAVKNYEFTERGLNTGKYNYRLKQIDFNGNFKYYELSEEVRIGIPNKYDLSQNYPNPFNPVTTINYDLPKDGIVTIKLYDILGREMKILVNEMKTAGYYKIQFNAGNLSSGVYFYRMTASDFVAVKKFVVLK